MKLSTGLLAWLVVTLTYMLTEQTGLVVHHPRYEFMFWVLSVTSLLDIILLAENSPIQFFFTGLNTNPLNIALICGVVAPLIAASLVETARVARLRQFQSRKARHDMAAARNNAESAHKIREVDTLLSSVVNNSHIRTFAAYLRGKLDDNRRQIHDTIVDATPKELDDIISSVNIPKLLTYGNHYVKTQQELGYSTLQYIIEQRENDLSMFARAALIHGLMRMQTIRFSKKQMEWTTKSFLGAKGEKLTLLKSLLDSSGDYNNLFKLVYLDITNEDLREEILGHVHTQAKEQIRLDRAAKKKRIKIFSDVDDTLSASGGRFPAGSDKRFPHHAIYPGCLALFEEIDVAARLSGTPISQDKRKSIKRLSKERRKTGVDSSMIEGELEDDVDVLSVYNPTDEDYQHDHSRDLSEMVKVTIELPWKVGGGVHHILFNANDPISKIHDEIEEEYGIPPWKQNLIIQPASTFEQNQSWKHGNVVFLSARPHAYKDLTEGGSYRMFSRLFAKGLMHATPTLLPGSMKSGAAAIWIRIRDEVLMLMLDLYDVVKATGTSVMEKRKRRKQISDTPADEERESEKERLLHHISSIGKRQTTNSNWLGVALTKFERFENYSMLYPEYSFVFFGDDGQGDLYTAEKMAVSKVAGKRLRKSFIHRVNTKEGAILSSVRKQSDREMYWEENGIVFFDTYVGAAIEALHSKLIPVRGLHRVTKRASEEMQSLVIEYPNFDFEKAISQYNRDIEEANKILVENSMNEVQTIG